ncbi:MAG: septal ring lytic transglycosylase RlpA family protein [Bacteroidetes bacterium]|nr:septal ring lytic transglycosylase RlpA family protein [Bacteroidota bacterium]
MRTFLAWCGALGTALWLTGCGAAAPRFTSIDREPLPSRDPGTHQLSGIASYYAHEFDGRRTANGETYDMHAMTAAHRTLPFNTTVKVTHLQSGESVVVRINDRGPFKDDRVIDLSLEAAKRIGLIANGTGPVRLDVLELGAPGKPANQ